MAKTAAERQRDARAKKAAAGVTTGVRTTKPAAPAFDPSGLWKVIHELQARVEALELATVSVSVPKPDGVSLDDLRQRLGMRYGAPTPPAPTPTYTPDDWDAA